jgi:hypothetical protein
MFSEDVLKAIKVALLRYKNTGLNTVPEKLEAYHKAVTLINALLDGDAIASLWWVDDVYGLTDDEHYECGTPRDITLEQARDTLRLAERNHNAEIGINWDSLRSALETVKGAA